VRKATIRSLLAHKLRLALTGLAIVLGVGFVAGTLILSDTLNATFDTLFKGIESGVDVRVRAKKSFSEQQNNDERQPVPASLLSEVRHIDGVKAAAGEVEGTAILIDHKGKAITPRGPPTLGETFTDIAGLSPYTLKEGHRPTNGNEVAIDAATAKKHGFRVGERVKVLLNGPAREFTLVGVFKVGTADTLLGATVTAFDTSTAQQVLDRPGQFSFINVKGDNGVSKTELRSRVNAALGGGYEALTGPQLAKEDASDVQQGIQFFSIFLLVFAGIALFVGTFMIANTFSIIVAQRTRELALLRALGAARRQVMASVLGEAFITAVVASVAGLAFGIGISYGIRALMDAIGFGLPAGSLVLSPRTFVVSLLVGIVVTVVSAAAPARRATRVAPIEAMREGGTPAATTSSRRRILLGCTTTVVGGGALALGLIGGGASAVKYVGLGVFLVFMGVAFLGPVLARPVARVVGAPLVRLFKLPAKLARENAMRNPRRTASTAAALMIGLALVTFVSVLSASVKTSTTKTIDKEFGADYTVTAGGFGEGFSPTVASDLAKRPELATVTAVRPGQFKLDGATKQLAGVEPDKLTSLLHLDVISGRAPTGSESGLLVSEKQARDHAWKVGSTVALQFARTGVQRISVAGIYAKNDLAGAYLLTLSDFERNYTTINDNLVVIKAAPGVSPARSRAAVERVLNRYPNLDVRDAAELKAQAASQINQLLGIVTALLAMAILIALLGIVNTLALSIFERTRELGLLRAVGMGRRQVRSMIRCEAVIISVFGALLGLVVGVFFGWALVAALHSRGVSTLTVPGGQLLVFVALAALAGVVAAVLPARRAARLDVLHAISHD